MKKTAIITGASGGMGREITKAVLEAGYEVIMACRNLETATPIFKHFEKDYGNSIRLLPVDLASLDTVFAFVEEVKKQYDAIHLLINNAGILNAKPENSKNGIEKTVAVNYLGHYILTKLLVPMMKKKSRIVNVVSLTYKYGKIEPDLFAPVETINYNRFKVYSNSKRALLYFTLDLAEQLRKKEIIVNCSDPGIVNTPIIRLGNSIIDKLCDLFFRPIIKQPKTGASTAIHLALSSDVASISGKCFANKKEAPIKKRTQKSTERELLIKLTQELLYAKQISL